VETPTDGEITITGYPHPVRNAAQAEQAGVLMMHQEPLIIDDFTVGENVWLYKLREGKDIRPWAKKVDTISAETRDVLQGVGLGQLSTRQPARDLSPGQRQMLSLSGVSLDVDPGEILGLYRLVGSGRSSVARTITGQRQAVNGSISLHGQQVSLPTPASGVAKRIAYLTEDRRLEGFVKDFDNGENMSLVVLPRMANAGVVNAAVEKKRVRELITEYQVKGGTDTYTRTLSGGNQQKVVVAKWLETDPDFVVLDEPTKGIDVGARANIYEIIHSLAARGKGVLVVSSEAEELLSLCHRILVMRNGQIVGEFDPEHATTDDLIRTALSHQD
jgi:ABC-type sugar transport system ATPase subunit